MSYREFLNKLLLSNEGSSGGASSWEEITDKPSAFPPSAHTHAQADVAGLTDIAAKAHTHANKTTLDKFGETNGKPTFDGAEIGGGGTVDESRLLPALDSVPVDRSGNPVVFKAVSAGMDKHTLLYCPFDADFNDHSSYARTVTHDTSRAGLSISLERNKFGTGSLQGTGYTTAGAVYVLMSTPIGAVDFTIHKWIYVTSAADRFGIFSTYGEAGSGTGTPGYGVDGLACWIDTDGTLKLYKASAHFSSYWYDDDSGNKLAEAAMPSDYLNRWVHIAVARSGNIWMLFADGSLLNSNSKEFNATQPYLRIGSADSKATAYGNIDEFIVLDYAKWTTDFEPPTQPASEVTKSYEVSDKGAGTVDESRLLPENPANGDIPCFDATATVGGGNDANTRILLHFDADEIKDEAAGNAAPVTITKKTGTITVVEGGKWGKCAKYVTGSMTVATNLDELNANNWVVSGWFNPDENNHGVSYPTWLSMDDSSTNGFMFDSTGRYGESDGPLFYLDTPPAAGTWHWLAIVKYSGGLRFYLNGAFLNEISAQQRANFCSTLAIGGFAGTYAAGSTERTFSGLVDEVRLQYIPDDEITQWTGTSIAVPDAPYSKPQTVGEWGKFNKAELAMKSELTAALTGKVNQSELAAYQKKSEAFSGQYSDLAGKPSTFPPAAHTHTIANVTDLQATVNKAHEHANKAALDKISETGGKLAYGGTAVGGVSSWTELADKPSTFPPAAHSHTIANGTDLQTMLNSKAASAHGHAVADVTGLQSLLDGKAAVGHTHAAADVAGLATTLAGKVSSVNGLTPDDSGALVLPQATSGAAGLMAAADKLKLDTFTNYTEKSGTENSGYIRFPGGLIMQFGSKEVLTPEAFVSGSIVFPRSFVDKPLSVTASVEIDNLTNAPFAISLYAPNTISVVFSGPIVGLPDTLEKIVLHWMAIGIEDKPPTNPSSGV